VDILESYLRDAATVRTAGVKEVLLLHAVHRSSATNASVLMSYGLGQRYTPRCGRYRNVRRGNGSR